MTGPLNGAFILGDIFDGFIRVLLNEAADFSLDIFKKDGVFTEPVEGVYKALSDLNIGDIDLESVLEALKTLSVKAVGPVTGLPTKMIFEVFPSAVSDIVDNDEPVRGALKLLGWSPYQVDKIYDKE